MPLNLLKKYNSLLDIAALPEANRKKSLLGIFNRDIVNNEKFHLLGKQIIPTPKDGEDKMSILFHHLTTHMKDKITRKRDFDLDRSCRLHWLKYLIDQNKKENILLFNIVEPEGLRTYYYDVDEKYVIIFEPLRNETQYYLLTAYHLQGKDAQRDKILGKYKRRLKDPS